MQLKSQRTNLPQGKLILLHHNSISKLNNDVQFRRRSGFFGVRRSIFGIARAAHSSMMPFATDSVGHAPWLAEKATDETPERAQRRASLQQNRPAELGSLTPVPSGIPLSLVLMARAMSRSPAEETDPAAPVPAKTPAPMERHACSLCRSPAQAYPFQLAPALIVAAGTSGARPKGNPASKRRATALSAQNLNSGSGELLAASTAPPLLRSAGTSSRRHAASSERRRNNPNARVRAKASSRGELVSSANRSPAPDQSGGPERRSP